MIYYAEDSDLAEGTDLLKIPLTSFEFLVFFCAHTIIIVLSVLGWLTMKDKFFLQGSANHSEGIPAVAIIDE